MSNTSPQSNEPKVNITDILGLGLGRIWDKLPFNKFTKTQVACFGAAVIIFGFTGYVISTGKTINGFPTGWDIRGLCVVAIVFFFIGVFYRK